MMLLSLAWKSLKSRALTTALTIFSIALSMMLLTGIDRFRFAAQEGFAGTISRTDLIVGARGGDLPLLLSTVFHLGSATNEISWDSYQHFAKHPAVGWTIPISIGDSHKGYRVVATDNNFYDHYQYRRDHHLAFAQGRAPSTYTELALGSEVAARLGYKLGQKLVLSHGIEEHSIIKHDNISFEVVGILAPTATPVDRGLYITLLGDKAMHYGWEDGTPPALGETLPPIDPAKLHIDNITSFLLGTKSRISTLMLQREINSYKSEPLTAIIPALTLQELWSILDVADSTLSLISAAVLVVGLLAMLIALYTALNERRSEIVLLRAVGVSAPQIILLFLLEAGLIATIGTGLGIGVTYLALYALRGVIESQFGLPVAMVGLSVRVEIYALTAIVSGLIVGLIPALTAYRYSRVDGLRTQR
jgi:putative ABC transport system permease protein